jgi:hypothetical protein
VMFGTRNLGTLFGIVFLRTRVIPIATSKAAASCPSGRSRPR